MFYKSFYFVAFILLTLVILPIFGIISKIEFNNFDLYNFIESNYNIQIIYISFFQALLSASICCLIAIPFSIIFYRNKNLKIIKLIISLCGYSFVIPSILIVHSVIGIYGTNGFINNIFNFYEILNFKSLFGLKAIVFAHILLNAPFATRILFQNLNTIPKKYIEIANSLNLKLLSFLIKIELPILKQNLFSTFAIIFILCFLSFAIVMTLGGGPSTSNIEVAIYQAALFELNFNKAIILSFIQMLICLILLLLGFYKLKGSNYFDIQNDFYKYPFNDYKILKYFDCIMIIIYSVFFFSPIIYILYKFINIIDFNEILLKEYFINAFLNSFIISLFTGLLVTISGLFLSILIFNMREKIYSQQILFILSSIIIVVSPIIISLGYFILLGELRYINSIIIIILIIINCLLLIPFSILILFTRIKNIYLNFDDSKKTFNLNEINFIRIIFPLIKNNLLFIYSLSVCISFGDFTIISFFNNDSFQTLPILLYKLIISYKFNEASFVAGFMLMFTLFVYLLFDNITYKEIPDKRI
ncbi:MAG: hypothetical protein CMI98_02415 [Pelagibacteraceae bacterium]|nr:hypothetical protein [Pelagibacteraceae bacterium]